MNGYFITGTDTNVGKTYVTCALARRARELGHTVFAFKPIETGCAVTHDGCLGADQELLADAAGDWQRGVFRALYRFALRQRLSWPPKPSTRRSTCRSWCAQPAKAPSRAKPPSRSSKARAAGAYPSQPPQT